MSATQPQTPATRRHGPRQLVRTRLFWIVLAIKLGLGSLAASHYLRDLFTPFVSYFVESGFANPWTHFAALGRLEAFPYPPPMLYILAVPRWIFSPLLAAGADTVTPLHLFVMRLPLLASDLLIAAILASWFDNRVRRVLVFYWCSPFVIYVCYWHGQLDIIPTALFLCSLHLLRFGRYTTGMAAFGLALGTKSHLLVALPFLLVYIREFGGWRRAVQGALIAAAIYGLAVAAYLPDPSFRLMTYGTREQARVFAFQIPFGSGELALLVAPAVLVLLFFRFLAYSKRNWDLFMLYLGILFTVFVLLAPPRPGYFLWSLPFIIHYLCREARPATSPYFGYAAAYLAFFWIGSQSDFFDAWRIVAPGWAAHRAPAEAIAAISTQAGALTESLFFTVMEASLAALVVNMYVFGVRSNAVYRMRTTPVLIGVAGDSGAGKDTFAELLARALGRDRTNVISGDDYHRWARGDEHWQVYTHLDVRGNDLHRAHDHAIALSRGKSVVKGFYDHTTGRFTEQVVVDPAEYVVFAGLHSLSIEGLRTTFDLRIFMDPDESLRRAWKVERDARERGSDPARVLESLDAREPDRQKYILPQREHADLVVRWRSDAGEALTLDVEARNTFNFRSLIERLGQTPTLTVAHEPFVDARLQSVRLQGTIDAVSVHRLAADVVVNLDEIAPGPQFDADLPGCLQVVVLVAITETLRWHRDGD